MRRERITITLKNDVIEKIDSIIDGQKIRNRSNAIETILYERFKSKGPEVAVILGAGHGIELNGKMTSKILLPLGDLTLIERNLIKLKNIGTTTVEIAAGEWAEDIKKVVGKGDKFGVKINYNKTDEGTAAILRVIKDKIGETFFMANGDILLDDIDLEDMFDFHKKNKGMATIAITPVTESSKLGSIFMKGNQIKDFKEKAYKTGDQSLLINAGIYFLEPDVCSLIPAGHSMVEHDLFPKLAKGNLLYGYQIGNEWVHLHDKDKYEEYLRTNKKG